MRGTWDDLNRRLTSAFIALDLDDALTIGDRVPEVKRRFGRKASSAPRVPRRWVMVTATRDRLLGEVVGATSFGGEWEMSPETEATLLKRGWEKPWSPDYLTWQKEIPLLQANRMALACVQALQLLGCEVADLEVEFEHLDPED